jgi:hypothetical protein
MLKSSSLCLHSSNLGTFWLKIEQFWPFEEIHFNLLLRNHWTNCNQTLVEWSLDGPLSKLCSVIPTSNQDGRQEILIYRGPSIDASYQVLDHLA